MPTPYIHQKLIDTLKDPATAGTVPLRDVISAIIDLEVKLRTEKYVSKTLRDGLKFYLPGPFWTDVVKETKAAEDQGKHADWIMRLTDDGTYSGAA